MDDLPVERFSSVKAGEVPAYSFLALHGFTGDGFDFQPLADAWPVPSDWLCPDLPGHGAHDVGGDPLRCTPEATTRFLESLPALPRPRILFGYSMGARAALLLAIHRPTDWDALVLVGANPGIEDPHERTLRAGADEKLGQRIVRDGIRPFIDYWQSTPLIASQASIDPSFLEPMLKRRLTNRESDLAASLRGFGAGNYPCLWYKLATIACPTLVVSGSKDPKYATIAERMCGLIPDATTVQIPDAGHMAHLEAPEVFNRKATRFLKQLTA